MAARTTPILSVTNNSARALQASSSPVLSPTSFKSPGTRLALEGAVRGYVKHTSSNGSPHSPQAPMLKRSLSFGSPLSPPKASPLVPLLDTRARRPLRDQPPITRPPAAFLGRPRAISSLHRAGQLRNDRMEFQAAVNSAIKLNVATMGGGAGGNNKSSSFQSPVPAQAMCPAPPSTPEPAVLRAVGVRTRRPSAHPGKMDLSSVPGPSLDVRIARAAPVGYGIHPAIPPSGSVGLGLGVSMVMDVGWGAELDLGFGAGLGLGLPSAAYAGQQRRSISMPRLSSLGGSRRGTPIEEGPVFAGDAGDEQSAPEWSANSIGGLSPASHPLPPSMSMPTPPLEQYILPADARVVLRPTLLSSSPSPLEIGPPMLQLSDGTAVNIAGADGGALIEGRAPSNPYFPRVAAPTL